MGVLMRFGTEKSEGSGLSWDRGKLPRIPVYMGKAHTVDANCIVPNDMVAAECDTASAAFCKLHRMVVASPTRHLELTPEVMQLVDQIPAEHRNESVQGVFQFIKAWAPIALQQFGDQAKIEILK